ncbi:MAG: hypothetical protein U0237_12835 [Thermoleophilia bacterium]
MPVERDEAIATWRRAEARVYPAVMVNAALYEQYLVMVRAVVDELDDVRTEDDLVIAWNERRGIAAEVIAAKQPSMGVLMDKDAVRDAAFCQRHRDITREQAKDIARERLEQARRDQAEWVVLFEDVTPFGSHRLEMHVRTGRAIHASSKVDLDKPRPEYSLEVVQLDPENGAWILDRPPLMPSTRCDTEEEWRVRIDQARTTFGRPT